MNQGQWDDFKRFLLIIQKCIKKKKRTSVIYFFKGDYNILTIPEEGIWIKWGFFYKGGKNGVAVG